MKQLAVFILMLVLAVMICGAVSVFAQEKTGAAQAGGANPFAQGGQKNPLLLVTAGFAMAIAAAGCGYAQSQALAAGCEGVSRNPGATDTIRFFIILGLAFIEFLALLTFVVAAILLFTPKFWPTT